MGGDEAKIRKLLDESSLGSERARQIRDLAPKKAVDEILEKLDERKKNKEV